MMNKKGLSDIVNMILIILLIIIAIVTIWFFVRPFIFNSSEKLETAGSCFQSSIEPTKCVYTKGLNGQRHIFLSIKREGQPGNISGIDLIFTTDNSELRTFRETQLLENITMPDQFETRKPIIQIDKSKTVDFIPKSLKIAIVLSNKGSVCPPFSQEITCKEYVFSGRPSDIDENGWSNGDDFDLFAAAWDAYCHDKSCTNPTISTTYNLGGIVYNYSQVFPIVDFNRDFSVSQEDWQDFQSVYAAGGTQ